MPLNTLLYVVGEQLVWTFARGCTPNGSNGGGRGKQQHCSSLT